MSDNILSRLLRMSSQLVYTFSFPEGSHLNLNGLYLNCVKTKSIQLHIATRQTVFYTNDQLNTKIMLSVSQNRGHLVTVCINTSYGLISLLKIGSVLM
jgi:hypothetical protein